MPKQIPELLATTTVAMLFVFIVALAMICPAQEVRWNIKYADQYLNDLKKCERPNTSYDECNMGTVINVAILDENRDPRALPALIDTARSANTTATDALSWYFSEQLCGQTQRFLKAVIGRSENERANLIYLAAIGESKNLGCLSITALRQELQTTAKSSDSGLAKLASQTLFAVNKWCRPNPNTGDCYVKDFKYKSESEIAAMGPRQLIEEMVQNEIQAPDNMSKSADNGQLLNIFLQRNALLVLPILTDYMNSYDPANRARCDEERYSVSTGVISSIDIKALRLRGVREGKLAIEAMERAIERMKKAGFEKPGVTSSLPSSLLDLTQLTGTNIRDDEIRDTLRAKNKIEMTHAEFELYIGYLIAHDPTYPTWSDTAPTYSPRPLLNDSSRFYNAYLEFKKRTPR